MPKKSSHQRPYKTRQQRREADRRKYDEAKDLKFLWRVASIVGILVIVAMGFAFKGMVDRNDSTGITAQAMQ